MWYFLLIPIFMLLVLLLWTIIDNDDSKIYRCITSNKYLYIVTRIYINPSTNKIVKKYHTRYNKRTQKFECYEGDDGWRFNYAQDNIFNLQEYDNEIFINENVVEQYIACKEQLLNNRNFLNIHKFIKTNGISVKVI